MEYFRSELVKAQYLFTSLTLSASIGSSTLETMLVRSLSNVDLQDPQRNSSEGRNQEDLIEIKRFSLLLLLLLLLLLSEKVNRPLFFFSSFRDLVNVDEHIHFLGQRYAYQITDWQSLGFYLCVDSLPW